VRAFTQAQLEVFLAAAERTATLYFPLFFTMARTGLRLGETVALKCDDVDLSPANPSCAAPSLAEASELRRVERRAA
jgi:integrase